MKVKAGDIFSANGTIYLALGPGYDPLESYFEKNFVFILETTSYGYKNIGPNWGVELEDWKGTKKL
jgi:hypothetical protein